MSKELEKSPQDVKSVHWEFMVGGNIDTPGNMEMKQIFLSSKFELQNQERHLY